MGEKIVVVGSSNTDMIMRVQRIPSPGETVIGGKFSIAAGGKGANQAVAAARAGGSVTFIARVGRDVFGEQAIAAFVKDQIDVHHVLRDASCPTGVALIFVDETGENSIAVASGANENVSCGDVQAAADIIAAADLLLMQLETPTEAIATAAEIAYHKGVKVILNPAPARPLPDSLLAMTTVMTPNQNEAEALTGVAIDGERGLADASEVLHGKGIKTVIITLGRCGVFCSDRGLDSGLRKLIPAFDVGAVDSTAAGDVFNGALAVALANGTELHDAIVFANAAAAISVTRPGAQPSIPIRSQIEDFLRQRAGVHIGDDGAEGTGVKRITRSLTGG